MNHRLFFGLLVVAAPVSAEQNLAEQRAADSEFRAIDLAEGLNFEVVHDVFGDARSVIGRFDVGLDSKTSLNGSRVAQAVTEFIAQHPAAWGYSAGFRPTLVGRDVLVVDNNFQVATFEQYAAGLKVLDGEITASFWADGSLHSLNGRLATWGILDDAPVLADVVSAFAVHGVDATRGTLERGLSIQYGGVVREHRDGPNGVVLDEESQVVLRTDDSQEPVTGPCNIRRFDVARSGANASNLLETTNTITETITCEAADVFGNCYWELRREPSGFDHGIGRVMDYDGAEQQVVQACSSGAVPQFTGTNGDALREQGAFYIENQMRFFIDQNVWSQVGSPTQQANVRITVDNPNVATAAFNSFYTDIDCNQNCGGNPSNCCTQDVLSHEYGHYVVWTYGGNFDDQCTAGTEEGNALDETLANVFGELFWLDDDQTNAQYGAIGGFALFNGPSAHTTTGTILAAAPSCPAGQAPNATDGMPFQQAVWELMFNRDCTLDACAATSGVGNRIWPLLGEEAVLTRVGASLGFALSVLGTDNITHGMVRAQMRQRIIADADSATGIRAQRVFSHHGLTCPTCCTGC